MKKQFLLKVQFKSDENTETWWRGALLDPENTKDRRYYDTCDDAKAALNRLLKKFNQNHSYDASGNRVEPQDIGGGFSADLVISKELDDSNRIVRWSIQERTVSPWSVVESGDGSEKGVQ